MWKKFKQLLFAIVWTIEAPIFHFLLRGKKRELLKPLSELTSKDEKLKEEKTLRILEIGIAGGSNLDYYPSKSHFVGVDTNDYFRRQLLNKLKDKDLVCEKLLCCPAECMKELDDNSFDAVISTFVFCSVNDPFKVVSEVHRVLVKGGKWFMLEHGAFQNRPFQILIQTLLKPFCKFFDDGCNIDRNMSYIVSGGQFAKQDIKYSESTVLGITVPIYAWYVGTATK